MIIQGDGDSRLLIVYLCDGQTDRNSFLHTSSRYPKIKRNELLNPMGGVTCVLRNNGFHDILDHRRSNRCPIALGGRRIDHCMESVKTSVSISFSFPVIFIFVVTVVWFASPIAILHVLQVQDIFWWCSIQDWLAPNSNLREMRT